jgi:hypothetical protein
MALMRVGTGIAREDAEFRLNTRCVLNSARMILGNVIWKVTRRCPKGLTESARI